MNNYTIKIAVCNRKTDKKYKNQEKQWGYIKDRNRNPIRTSETAEEYPKLQKAQRDAAKDHGGFVGGWLREGVRKNGNVLGRSLGVLDADYISPNTDFPFLVELALADTEYFIYSTHSHTPETPRYRLVFPFSREVSEDEYPAVMRMAAKQIDMACIDPGSFQANRMMYWASCPSNGEFVFLENSGAALDPDKYLGMYRDWRDAAQWPVAASESEARKREVSRQQDPLEKDGVIGAYNHVHFPIEDFLETELADIYEPAAGGRYGYIAADSTAGVVVYENKWIYSNHASDPAYGRLLNAFDLMRVHRFGHLDDKAAMKACLDAAGGEDAVKAWLAERRLEKARTEFADDGDWQKALELDKQGAVKDSFGNYLLILNHDPALVNIAFNQMRDGVDKRGPLPWVTLKPGWGETDAAKLYEYLQIHYGIYSPTKAAHAVVAAAAQRVYHPIRDYLNALPEWDGAPRVETLIIDYFGAEDNSYVRAVTRKTFAAAVARVFNPGIKFDYMLVLNGKTGLGKSTFFDKLAGEWFSDSLTFADMGKGKDAPEKIQGFWIVEIPEMAGIRKTDVNNVKAFISRRDDNYRASYGHNSESHPRQCIIVGSTNSEAMGFLRDVTGNRRFWPIRVGSVHARRGWDVTDEDVLQIWAEAKALYDNGEKLYLEGAVAELAESAQKDALETDEREGMVKDYLEKLLPENWDTLDIYRRQEYFRSGDDPMQPVGVFRRDTVCNMEIWCECFGKHREDFERTESYKIMSIMEKIGGWTKSERKKRIREYGVVPVWEREGR